MWICRIFHIFDGCTGASPYTTHSVDIRNAAPQWHEAYELILGFFFSFLPRNWLCVYYSINNYTKQSGPIHWGLSVEKFYIRTVENSVSELLPEMPANWGLLKCEDFSWVSSSCSLAPKSPRQIGTYGVYHILDLGAPINKTQDYKTRNPWSPGKSSMEWFLWYSESWPRSLQTNNFQFNEKGYNGMCRVKFQVKKPLHAEGQRRESRRATARECTRARKDQSQAHQGTVSSDVDMSTPGWPIVPHSAYLWSTPVGALQLRG